MDRNAGATTVDEYLAQLPDRTRVVVEQLRAVVREVIPDAVETISYGIPTFDIAGRHVVHIGGFERHVGLYPTPSGMEEFAAELAPYVRGKGSVRFALDEPLPVDLVRRIATYRAAEVRAELGGAG